jgi:nitroimidazol reductase NimA-like FMN-containing flavoprotein (pyridoxamine 5'-phosphate oxidase superfamily)
VAKHDSNGLEVLDHAECLRLLASASLGRIGLSSGALPVVLPVNFTVIDDQIVVRTRRGTRLSTATRNAIVAFEVDELDPETGAGWSVMVQGLAREVSDVIDLASPRHAALARWIDPHDARDVAISIDVVSGRRVPPLVDGASPVAGTLAST